MLSKMQSAIAKDDKIAWIHVASLGDFEQGRPLVDYIKEHKPDYFEHKE
jgi:3-deoxy-D-manno-octulosonic-acid transferase